MAHPVTTPPDFLSTHPSPSIPAVVADGTQPHAEFNPFGVFKIQPRDDFRTVFDNASAGIASDSSLSEGNHALQSEVSTTGDGLYISQYLQGESLQPLNPVTTPTPWVGYHQQEGATHAQQAIIGHGTSSNSGTGRGTGTSFTPQGQLSGNTSMTPDSMGVPTGGSIPEHSFHNVSAQSSNAAAHTVSADTLDRDVELRYLREENQLMRRFICMLLGRENV